MSPKYPENTEGQRAEIARLKNSDFKTEARGLQVLIDKF